MRKGIATALVAIGIVAGCSGGPLSSLFCSDPAPLLGVHDPGAPGYIVFFVESTDVSAETSRLARLYGFTPVHIFEAAFPGFSAQLSSVTLARLRCEPSVRAVEHDGVSRPS